MNDEISFQAPASTPSPQAVAASKLLRERFQNDPPYQVLILRGLTQSYGEEEANEIWQRMIEQEKANED